MDFTNELTKIVSNFRLKGTIKSIDPYGNGHINRTFLVKTDVMDYILQEINSYAFKDVDLLMNNILYVTEYIKSIGQESMTVIKTNDDKLYYKVEDKYFRVYEFVMNSLCYEEITDITLIDKDAEAFGQLHKSLAKFDATKLGETIKDFHNTPKRFNDLLEAIKLDSKNRKQFCTKEIEKAMQFSDKISKIVDGIKAGTINLATTHNDPKINNVLFDKDTGKVRCVIDLDTIMPGSVLYDVGDSLRSLFTGKNEDSEDLSKLVVNYDIYKHYVSNYLAQMEDTLTPTEKKLIPYSAFLLTFECGIRFLEDYLRGDVYFHVKKENHNLIRARTQLTLAENIYNALYDLERLF